MKKIFICFCLLSFLIVSSYSKNITDKSIQNLIELSGIKKQIVQLPSLLLAGVKSKRDLFKSKKEAIEFEKAIFNSFSLKKFESNIISEVKNSIKKKDIEKLLIWYKSESGKNITKAEEKASTPKAYKEMMTQAEELKKDKPRLKFANEIEEIINSTEFIVKLQEKVKLGVFVAIAKIMNDNQKDKINWIKKRIENEHKSLVEMTKKFVLISFVYCYRNISIKEIKKYINFMKSSNGDKFNSAILKGLNKSFNEYIDDMSKAIAKVYKNNNKTNN